MLTNLMALSSQKPGEYDCAWWGCEIESSQGYTVPSQPQKDNRRQFPVVMSNAIPYL